MPGRGFDEFWAIDWSGAKAGTYRGIAIARALAGRRAPRIVSPGLGAAWWTRAAALGHLRQQLAGRRRILVGFDFPFGLPAPFPLGAAPFDATWRSVERECKGDRDFYAGSFAVRRPAAFLQPRAERSPAWFPWIRDTDRACARALHVTPETPFKLIGPKQAGMAGLAGMRVLLALKHFLGDALAVWPFEPVADRRVVVVEIFPTVFRHAAGFGTAKLRSGKELDRALAVFGSEPARLATPSDDETDAMVSAAALRRLARLGGSVVFKRKRRPRNDGEGWIFGVPA